jgi:hypothetical protein
MALTAFVQPTSGETVWYLSDGVSKLFFEKLAWLPIGAQF